MLKATKASAIVTIWTVGKDRGAHTLSNKVEWAVPSLVYLATDLLARGVNGQMPGEMLPRHLPFPAAAAAGGLTHSLRAEML